MIPNQQVIMLNRKDELSKVSDFCLAIAVIETVTRLKPKRVLCACVNFNFPKLSHHQHQLKTAEGISIS